MLLVGNRYLANAEEKHVPYPEDYNCFDKIEEILKELNAERIKNKDLNQTISNILEEMEDMKKNIITLSEDVATNGENIIRNGEKITDNQSSMLFLKRDIEDLHDEIITVAEDIATTNSSFKVITDNLSTSLSIVSTTLTESFLPLKSLVLDFHSDYFSRYEEEASISADLQRVKMKETNDAGDQVAIETDQLESALANYEDSTFKKQLFAFLQALNGVTAGISKMDPQIAEDAIISATEVDGSIGDVFDGIVDVIRTLSILEDALDYICGGDNDCPDMNGDIVYYISTRWPNALEDVYSLKNFVHIFNDIR